MTGRDDSHTLPVESGAFALDFELDVESGASSRYVDERLLGRGGMGEVWQAWDTQLRRQVAIKRVRDGGNEALRIRLVREARITAALEHPGIVSVHDAGTDAQGRPWYAMQLVRGKTLAEHLAEDPSRSERRRLLRHVLAACEAVGFAHHAGVVHRDIKPDNLQIGAFGETQVLDWGLARPLREEAAWDEVLSRLGTLTEVGLVLGTPNSMSPEQAAGEFSGPPGDVWSLGIVLYEVVSGVPAYSGPSSQEVLRKVLAGPPPPVVEHAPDTASELVAILARALAFRPEDRYADAAEMAADLGAYLDGRRVDAHQYTPADELRRVLHRWRVPLLAVAAGAIGLATAGVIGGWSVWQEQRRLRVAEQDLQQALGAADRRLGEALTQRALLAFRAGDVGKAQLLAAEALGHIEDPDARGILADASPHPRRLSRTEIADCGAHAFAASGLVCADARGTRIIGADGQGRWVSRVPARGILTQPWTDELAILGESALFTVDGRGDGRGRRQLVPGVVLAGAAPSLAPGLFVGVSTDIVRVFGLITGSAIYRDGRACGAERIRQALLLAEDDVLVWCDGGTIRRGPPDATRVLHTLDGDHNPDSAAVDVAGRRVAFGEITGDVFVLDVESGEEVLRRSLGPGRVDHVALSADGSWLAARVPGAGLELIQVATGRRVNLPSQALNVGFHVDGTLRVWTPGALEVWVLPQTEAMAPATLNTPGVVSLSWADAIMVGLGDGGYAELSPHADRDRVAGRTELPAVKSLAKLEDGRTLVATLFEVFIDAGEGPVQLPRHQVGRRVLPMRDGHVLVLGVPTWLWDVRGDRDLMWEAFVSSLEGSVSADGRVAAIVSDSGLSRLVLEEPVVLEPLGDPGANAVALGVNGWPVYLGGADGVSVMGEDRVAREWVRTGAGITDLVVSPDGALVAAADTEQRVWVWRAADGVLLARLRGHSRRVSALAFSPDGAWLATGSWDDTVRFWKTSRLFEPVAELREQVQSSWGITAADLGE